MRNLRSELEEFNGQYSPSWKLEEGAIVVGPHHQLQPDPDDLW